MTRILALIVVVMMAGCQNLEPIPVDPVVVDLPVIDAGGGWTVVETRINLSDLTIDEDGTVDVTPLMQAWVDTSKASRAVLYIGWWDGPGTPGKPGEVE